MINLQARITDTFTFYSDASMLNDLEEYPGLAYPKALIDPRKTWGEYSKSRSSRGSVRIADQT